MLRLKELLGARWPLRRRGERRAGWIRGRYELGPEVSSFRPEGSAERWWTSFHGSISKQAGELLECARGAGVDVELLGEVSQAGEYGHVGMYARAFLVRGIRNLDRPGTKPSATPRTGANATAAGPVNRGGGERAARNESCRGPRPVRACGRREKGDATGRSGSPGAALVSEWGRGL